MVVRDQSECSVRINSVESGLWQTDLEAVLGGKASLKNKVKEYRTKLHEMAEQFEEQKRKSASAERDTFSILERETQALTQALEREKRTVETRVEDLERELRANTRVKTFSHQAVHKVRKYIIYIIYGVVYQTIVW